jgi:hypothetical protein
MLSQILNIAFSGSEGIRQWMPDDSYLVYIFVPITYKLCPKESVLEAPVKIL